MIKAWYFTPTKADQAKNWYSAKKFCNKVFHAETGTYLDLPVGFNSAEIKYLAKFQHLNESQHSHLGFSFNSSLGHFQSNVGDLDLYHYSNLDYWDSSFGITEAKYYGCLDMATGHRSTCNSDWRPFVCAIYYEYKENEVPDFYKRTF